MRWINLLMLNHELECLLQISPTIQAKCIKNMTLADILISFSYVGDLNFSLAIEWTAIPFLQVGFIACTLECALP